jgi:hypothetical protein
VPEAVVWLVPALVAASLCVSRLGLGYFWDDYIFLTMRGTGDWAANLRPDPSLFYYRPIPQGLYFLFLRLVDPRSGLTGHIGNLLLLMLCAALVTRWARKVAGPWTGFLAGLAFATLGAAPSLVAWVTAAADLFATAFLLLALNARHDGRLGLSALFAALALLSKESAAGWFPLLIGYDFVLGREPRRLARSAIAFGAVLVLWAGIHPGLHKLLAHGLRAPEGGYVGLGHFDRWGLYLGRYLLALVNVPATWTKTPWPADLNPVVTLAAALALVGFAWVSRGRTSSGTGDTPSTARLVAIALLLSLPALALPILFVEIWVPYYIVIIAPGTCLLLALGLRSLPRVAAGLALAAFLLLGVWFRGMAFPTERVWSEPVLVDAAQAIDLVRHRVLTIQPTVPRRAQLLVSVAATGSRGIAATLFDGQAPSVWYRDPSVHAAKVEDRAAGYSADLLWRITGDLHVIDIDPVEGRFRSTAQDVEAESVGRPIATYARAVAASGEPDRAVRILEHMGEIDHEELRSYDLRLAASIALAYGRPAEAERLRSSAPPIDYETAVNMMGRVFGNPSRNPGQDSCAYWAFQISPDDTVAIRHYLSVFRELGNPAQIDHFAKRMLVLAPGDAEATEALRALGRR